MTKVAKSKEVTKTADCNGWGGADKALKEEAQKCFKPISFKIY